MNFQQEKEVIFKLLDRNPPAKILSEKGGKIMSFKNVLAKVFVILLTATFVAGFSSYAGAAAIKVGALNDFTGATSDVGKDYGLGISDAINYVNDNGGKKKKPDAL